MVFDQSRGTNQPKARFAYLFPTANSALIQARLKPKLTPDQQAAAIAWIRQAVKMPIFKLGYGGTLHGQRRAGRDQRPRGVDHRLDRGAARSRRCS